MSEKAEVKMDNSEVQVLLSEKMIFDALQSSYDWAYEINLSHEDILELRAKHVFEKICFWNENPY